MKRGNGSIGRALLVLLLINNCDLTNENNSEPRAGKDEAGSADFSALHSYWRFAEEKGFSGGQNASGSDTGDNRGRYEYENGTACFVTSPSDYRGIGSESLNLDNMEISVSFGIVTGNTIPVTIRQISLKAENIYNYETAVSRTAYIRSPVPDLVWSGNGTILEKRIDLKIKNKNLTVIAGFSIFKLSESALAITYDFNTGNPMAGYGIVIKNGEGEHEGLSGTCSARSKADGFDIETLKPKNIPVSRIPDLDWMEFRGTIKAGGSAFNFKSGKWDGVIQIDFIKPYSYAEHPVSMVIIDDSGNAAENKICNFNDPDGTNEFYYSWGANIRLPESDRRYTAVFRNYTGSDITFRAKTW